MRIPKSFLYIFSSLALLFSSCEKEESPIAPSGGGMITADIGPNYENQSFFNLLSGEFTQVQKRDHSHLWFECASPERGIYLNSGNFMYCKTFDRPFEQVTDTAGGVWDYDFPTGEREKSAIGIWHNPDGTSKNKTYVLDLGFDLKANSLGFKKVQIISGDNEKFVIRTANLDNSEDTTYSVFKRIDYYLTGLNLLTGIQVDFQPPSSEWNFLFTQYTDFDLTSEGDTQSYLVRGVILNPLTTEASLAYEVPWNKLDITDAAQFPLSRDWNVVGWNWKYYDFDGASYSIAPGYHYLVKTKSGNWYKMRFTGYYNDKGEKGYPQFEIKSL